LFGELEGVVFKQGFELLQKYGIGDHNIPLCIIGHGCSFV
jgi:hypothetical protein